MAGLTPIVLSRPTPKFVGPIAWPLSVRVEYS
jgi:hypothetical protein